MSRPARIAPVATPRGSPFLRAWRGEIGLYRAAYGLGGLGLALASLLGDVLVSAAASTGGFIGCLFYLSGAAGALAVASFSFIATCRAARKGPASIGRPYGRLTVGAAIVFVGLQFALTVGWSGWSGLAEVGLAPDPDRVLFRALARATASDRFWLRLMEANDVN